MGGGAVLFDILSNYDLEEVYISDINAELINVYQTIRDNPDKLIEILCNMQDEFISLDLDDRKKYYLQKREWFHFLKIDDGAVEKAALMIFLNKTCFNGLFRVNQKGLFNVPMGAYQNPLICDRENICAVLERLQKVTIVCQDYKKAIDFIDNSTFVYIDPPYRPLTNTANFTAYTVGLFCDDKQKELANFVYDIHQKGAKVLVSNSDPKNIDREDDFFDTLYQDYQIQRVNATRIINCNRVGRGKIKEILISNIQEE